MTNENEHRSLADSLGALSPEQLTGSNPKPAKKLGQIVSSVLRIVFILVCLVVLVVCIFTLAENLLEYAEAQEYYDKLIDDIWENDEIDLRKNPYGDVVYSERDYLHSATSDYDDSQKHTDDSVEMGIWDSDEMIRVKAKLGALYAQNNDLIAWITIPDTIINYPVVLTDNNEYYLNHNFQGDFLIAGTIFADYRNSAELMENYNTVLYGHNVNSGNMFSSLSKYFTKSFYNAHPDIYLYTMDGIYIYRVFNVSKVSSTGDYIRTYFPTPDEFVEFAEAKAKSSVYKSDGLTFTGSDRILTLSTCTNAHLAEERYCIQAKLVEVRQ